MVRGEGGILSLACVKELQISGGNNSSIMLMAPGQLTHAYTTSVSSTVLPRKGSGPALSSVAIGEGLR